MGALNLTPGIPLSVTGSASLNGSLNLFGSSGGTRQLIGCSSLTGSFSQVSGAPYGYAVGYYPTQVDLTYAANDSVLGVSTPSVSLGRVMRGGLLMASVTITNSGTLPTGLSTSGSGAAMVLPGNLGPGAVLASGSASITVGLLTNATGSVSGAVQVLNSGNGGFGGGPSSAGPNLGSAQKPSLHQCGWHCGQQSHRHRAGGQPGRYPPRTIVLSAHNAFHHRAGQSIHSRERGLCRP